MDLTLSIVVPVKNAAAHLGPWRRALELQRGAPAFEVIAVDSGSTDSTPDMLERLGVKVLRIPAEEFGHGKSRNLAISAAQGDLVLLTVQDALPLGPGFLASICRPFFEDERLAGVRARQVPPPEVPAWAAWLASRCPAASKERAVYRLAPGERLGDMPRNRVLELCGLDFVASCIRRSAWQSMALPEVPFGEDRTWTATLLERGWTWMHEPEAVVMHAHARTPVYTIQRAYLEEASILQHLLRSGTGSGLFSNIPPSPFGPLAEIPLGLASVARDAPWFMSRSGGLPGGLKQVGQAWAQVAARGLGAALARLDLGLGRKPSRFQGRV